jgi:hypothetical protein
MLTQVAYMELELTLRLPHDVSTTTSSTKKIHWWSERRRGQLKASTLEPLESDRHAQVGPESLRTDLLTCTVCAGMGTDEGILWKKFILAKLRSGCHRRSCCGSVGLMD